MSKFANLTTGQRHSIILGACSLIVIAIVVGVIYPTSKQINNINTDTVELRNYLEKKYENVRRLHSTKEKVIAIKEQVAGFEKYLYSLGDELKLITLLEDTATDFHIEQGIDNTNLDKINNKQIEFNLTVSGKYAQLLEYANALEHGPYFFNIGSFSLTPTQNRDGSDTGWTVMRITLLLYAS